MAQQQQLDRIGAHALMPDVLTVRECAALVRFAAGREPLSQRTAVHPTFVLVPEPERGPAVKKVQAQLRRINRERWRLPQDAWHVTISSYTTGNYFPEHCDHNPDVPGWVPGITFAASVLLSDPGDFTGGTVHIDGEAVPKIRGSAACFHAFAPHSVDRIDDGERLALNVFGTLGTLNDALRRGWPARWLYAGDE